MINKTTPLGPNVKRLLVEFMAKRQVDRAKANRAPGEFGLVAAIASSFVNDPHALSRDGEAALADVNTAISSVRTASEPNPFKESTDEEIASAILERLNKRRGTERGPRSERTGEPR